MILVTGAGGNAGSAVVRALAAAGEQVRALLRPGSPAATTLPAGVEAASGDLNQPGSLRQPLQGVEAVFLLSGYDGLAETLEEMRAAGVRRVVLLSSSAAPSGDTGNAESQVLPTVEEVTGRPPGSFERWARAHAGTLTGG